MKCVIFSTGITDRNTLKSLHNFEYKPSLNCVTEISCASLQGDTKKQLWKTDQPHYWKEWPIYNYSLSKTKSAIYQTGCHLKITKRFIRPSNWAITAYIPKIKLKAISPHD